MSKYGCLGPKGTFSHDAILKYDKNSDILFVKDILDVFETIENGNVEYGVIPIENSLEGDVNISLDALWKYNHMVKGEIIIPIDHYLCGLGKIEEINKVYSHPQALAQCMGFLKELGVEKENETSTAAAAKRVAEEQDVTKAAICSKPATKIYGLKILKERVQDVNEDEINKTRFLVINDTDEIETGNDKTSIIIYGQDRPGLLYGILRVFKKRDINLTGFALRPSRKALGDYRFYIDFEGHRNQKVIKEALQELYNERDLEVKLLGSYPKGR